MTDCTWPFADDGAVPIARPNWRCPDGQLALRADAPRQEWLNARRTGIGSSDASAVLGINPYTSPFEVWAEKRGLLPPDDDDSDAMLWGRLLEPVIASWWADEHGIPVRRAGLMRSKLRPWQLASVDRLTACGGVLEVKTLGWRVADDWADGQTPDHAEVQTQHQLAVTGRSHAHVVGLQDGRKPILRTILRDGELHESLNAVEAVFWQWVLDDIEPPVDGSSATTNALNARWAALADQRAEFGPELQRLAENARRRKAEAKAAEEAADLAENELRLLLGEATEGFVELPAPDDRKARPLVTYRRNGAASEKRLRAWYPDVVAAVTVTKTVEAIDLDALKLKHPEAYAACRARVLRIAKPPKKETATRG